MFLQFMNSTPHARVPDVRVRLEKTFHYVFVPHQHVVTPSWAGHHVTYFVGRGQARHGDNRAVETLI